jgi:hypothetical protein
VAPALRLNDQQARSFAKLGDALNRHRDELLREAVTLLLDKYQRRT